MALSSVIVITSHMHTPCAHYPHVTRMLQARGLLLSLLIIFCLSPILVQNVPELEGLNNIIKPIVVRCTQTLRT